MLTKEQKNQFTEQEEVSNWIAEKLETRQWSMFELPGLLAKFGLMNPAEFKEYIKSDTQNSGVMECAVE
jgi:hypothetical protein